MPKSRLIVAAVLLSVLAGCKNKSEQHCRQAISEYNTAVAGTSSAGGANAPLPLEPFLTQCKALSPEAAQCAVLSYRTGHEVECRAHEPALRNLARSSRQ